MRSLLSRLALAGAMALPCSAALSAPVVKFTPSQQHVAVGDAFRVDVSISGLGAEVLSGFDLNFRYDAALIDFAAVDHERVSGELGADWGVEPLIEYDTQLDGDIGVQAVAFVDDASLVANQSDAFLLFSFDLIAEAEGLSMFTLGDSLLFERNIVGLNFATLDVEVQGACIAIGNASCGSANAVPEPESWLLVLAAIGAMVFVSRRI